MFDIYRIIIYQKKYFDNLDFREDESLQKTKTTFCIFCYDILEKNIKKTKFSMKTIFIDFSEGIIVFCGFVIIIYLYRKCQTLYPNLFI